MPIQRLNQIVYATSDGNGNIVWDFGNCPAALAYQGTLNVPSANSALALLAYVGGSALASGLGPAVFGPVQYIAGEDLKVVGTMALPTTPYSCTLTGYATSMADFQPVFPQVTPLALQTTVVPPTASGSSLITDHTAVGLTPPTQLPNYPLVQGVVIRANSENTGPYVWVGNLVVVSTHGYELAPGENITLPLTNTDQIAVTGSVSTDAVSFIGV